MCTMPLYGSSCSSIATNNAPKDKLSYYISFNGLVYVVGHSAGATPCPPPVVFICPELKSCEMSSGFCCPEDDMYGDRRSHLEILSWDFNGTPMAWLSQKKPDQKSPGMGPHFGPGL